MAEAFFQGVLRVKTARPSRRRAGFAFGREAVELTRKDLGDDDLAIAEKLLAIVEDQVLVCVIVDEEGGETTIDVEEVEMVREVVAIMKANSTLSADTVKEGLEQVTDQALGASTELQPASGAEGETGGAAASSGDAPASSGEPNASGALKSSPGTETSSADASGQTREEADASTADRKVDADVGNQPEDTPQPPAAELNTENGSSAAPAAKPAGKAKPKSATEAKA
ncbi:hypothetical protein [Novosphingobium clariflavum]|uniref:Uncharacterized protein n=1 Tax=Novosphingobium clariflavum TaxID=2029884 RepID=A0ABV6SAX7_9SPHN|nr:hypothetical protein [Novosphingobium clariflavum]